MLPLYDQVGMNFNGSTEVLFVWWLEASETRKRWMAQV
jgi:hypothetical protein